MTKPASILAGPSTLISISAPKKIWKCFLMSIKKQIETLKDNWLIAAVVLVLIIVMNAGLGGVSSTMMEQSSGASYDSVGYARSEMMPLPSDGGFAPEVTERKITKTAGLETEVQRGEFQASEQRLKGIVSSSEAILLNENVNKYETGRKEYFQGTYRMKVDTGKYGDFVSQLKGIGEVKLFSESSRDITERYTDTKTQLELEKARLESYRKLYDEAEKTEDKMNINDRIFSQESTVKYLEETLENLDQKIDYSTVSFTMTEKRSDYADMVDLSSLAQTLVGSVSSLLIFTVAILPWVLAGMAAKYAWKLLTKKKK